MHEGALASVTLYYPQRSIAAVTHSNLHHKLITRDNIIVFL